MNRFICLLVFFTAVLPLSLSGHSVAAVKKPYVVKVGDLLVTSDEYRQALIDLHTSDRAAKTMIRTGVLDTGGSVKSFDYRAYLDELIDIRLMVLEAESLGIDKDESFVRVYDLFVLNLSLAQLRAEEIQGKATVTDDEVAAYKAKIQEGAESSDAAAEAVKTPHAKDPDRQKLLKERIVEREKEFFADLLGKARIKVYDKMLLELSIDMEGSQEKVVAKVDGKPVYAIDILRVAPSADFKDEATVKRILDQVILHKVLDAEALRMGYYKLSENAALINKFRTRQLVDRFKKDFVRPAVSVDDEEVLSYYNANLSGYMEPDKFELKLIQLWNVQEANDVIDELKGGADFAHLASLKSIGTGKQRGGDIGWVPSTSLSQDNLRDFNNAKPGDILGPYSTKRGVDVYKYVDFKKGSAKPLDEVQREIVAVLARAEFKVKLEEYLVKLRQSVPIEINEEEFKRVINE